MWCRKEVQEMKCAVIYPLIPERFFAHLAVSISISIVLALATTVAQAVPVASTWVYTWDPYGGSTYLGPAPVTQDLSLDREQSGTDSYWGAYDFREVTSVLASIIPAGEGRSSVQVSAYVSAVTAKGRQNEFDMAEGEVDFSFKLREIVAPPFEPPVLPVHVDTHGQGSATGVGSYGDAGYWVETVIRAGHGGPVVLQQYLYYYGVVAHTDTYDFSQDILLLLDQKYIVDIFAAATAEVDSEIASSNEVHAFVDPIITLDQAAFDSMYGALSFPLADFYSAVFSPETPANTPVPEATTMLLLGPGLIGLWGFRKKFKK
jgi:hypothetical protein